MFKRAKYILKVFKLKTYIFYKMPRKAAKKTEKKEKPPPKKRGRKPKIKTNVEKPPPKKEVENQKEAK